VAGGVSRWRVAKTEAQAVEGFQDGALSQVQSRDGPQRLRGRWREDLEG
jgi:hypothetical protein